MWGHDVTAETDGASALARASRSLPDVVLLDIGMPGMDGYTVARALRELQGGRDLLVIALTGYGSANDRRKSADSGIDHHLVKPVDFVTLQGLLAG
jgi:CheY-like chemotaxis protein